MNLSKIDDLKPYAVNLTEKLIQVPTENPPGKNYYQCVVLLKAECETLGLDTELIQVENSDRYIVLAKTGKKKTELHFHCHYDVVPAGPGWSVNPFGGKMRNSRIYGRGSSDMKGGIASVFTALKALDGSGNISVSLTPDEETGGERGAAHAVKNRLIHTEMAVLPEPTGLKTIFTASKGALWIEVHVSGAAGHPSVKGYGLNAFDRMVEVASRLQDLKTKIENRKSTLKSYPEGGEWANLTLGGRCSTGEAVNVVPGEAKFTLDRRILPEESMEKAKQEILECMKNNAEAEVLLEAHSFSIDEKTTVCQLLKSASEKVTGNQADCALCPGFLDARHFVHAGIPCATYGPGIYENAHRPDEYIRIQDIMTAAKIFYTMAAR